MANTISSLNRREFLAASLGSLSRPGLAAEKKTVAAIVTETAYYSHADVICRRSRGIHAQQCSSPAAHSDRLDVYGPDPRQGHEPGPAAKHNFKIYPTVAEALTLGGKTLGVDAVLLIGEHGNYPTNGIGQTLYRRYELFEQIIQVFRKSSRAVPLFSDKHLSYSWPKARDMYRQAREIGFPFMAGSSIPVTIRFPNSSCRLTASWRTRFRSATAASNSYGFHTLETLQCMVERRAGGEKGLEAVETREGEAVWNWRDSPEGRWSAPLLSSRARPKHREKSGPPEQNARKPHCLPASIPRRISRRQLHARRTHQRFFVCGEAQRPRGAGLVFSSAFPAGRDLPHFDGLVHCIEEMFVTRRAVYPVERTVLTTGALAFLLNRGIVVGGSRPRS